VKILLENIDWILENVDILINKCPGNSWKTMHVESDNFSKEKHQLNYNILYNDNYLIFLL